MTEPQARIIRLPYDGWQPQPIRVQTDMEIAVKIARILFNNEKIIEIIQARLRGGEQES